MTFLDNYYTTSQIASGTGEANMEVKEGEEVQGKGLITENLQIPAYQSYTNQHEINDMPSSPDTTRNAWTERKTLGEQIGNSMELTARRVHNKFIPGKTESYSAGVVGTAVQWKPVVWEVHEGGHVQSTAGEVVESVSWEKRKAIAAMYTETTLAMEQWLADKLVSNTTSQRTDNDWAEEVKAKEMAYGVVPASRVREEMVESGRMKSDVATSTDLSRQTTNARRVYTANTNISGQWHGNDVAGSSKAMAETLDVDIASGPYDQLDNETKDLILERTVYKPHTLKCFDIENDADMNRRKPIVVSVHG